MREGSTDTPEQAGLFDGAALPAHNPPATKTADGSIRQVPVSAIRLWSGNPRSQLPYDAKRDAALTENIALHGQKVPCIVRPLEDMFELIAGCRRYGSVAHLAIAEPSRNLLVEVRPMSDVEAFVLVDTENAARKDVTAYERASYQQWALAELFGGSQARLAGSLKISETTLSRSLDLVRLPAEVKAIIADLNALTPNMVAAIAPKCNKPGPREQVIAAARAVGVNGKTLPAGRAIALIKAHLDPVARSEPLEIAHATTGRKARIIIGPTKDMVIRVPLQSLDEKASSKWIKEIGTAMQAYAAQVARDKK